MEKGIFNKNKIFNINLLYVLSLIPIVAYTYYKNGIIMLQHDKMNFFNTTQYFVIPIVIVALSYIFEIYYRVAIKKEENLDSSFNTIIPYINVLCYLVCGPMDKLYITIPIIVVLDIFLKLLENKAYINQVALFKIILFCTLSALSMYNNANLYERVTETTFKISDYFIGLGVGEIGTTTAFGALLGSIILLYNKYYKYDISIASILTYILVGGVLYIFSSLTMKELLINTFTSGFFFVAIFVSTISNATPVVKSGRILYGIAVGLTSAVIINMAHFNIGIYIAVFVLGLLSPMFNKFKVNLD